MSRGCIPLGRLRDRWKYNIKMDLQEVEREAWTRLIWLKISTGGGRMSILWWTFGFRNMQGISWLAEDLLASQEGLCSMGVSFFISLLMHSFILSITETRDKQQKISRQHRLQETAIAIMPVYTDRCDQISTRQYKNECSSLSNVAATNRCGVNERFVYVTKHGQSERRLRRL